MRMGVRPAEDPPVMKLWRRQESAEKSVELELAELDYAELRTAVPWCRSCRRSQPPYVYFENGKHYCMACAISVRWKIGVPIAGRRSDDIKEVPLPTS